MASKASTELVQNETWNAMMKSLNSVTSVSEELLAKFEEAEKQWPQKNELGAIFLHMVNNSIPT